MKKKVDNLGRIGIPKFIRDDMELNKDPILSIEYDPDQKQITLKKTVRVCAVCGSSDDLLTANDQIFLCKKCLKCFDPE